MPCSTSWVTRCRWQAEVLRPALVPARSRARRICWPTSLVPATWVALPRLLLRQRVNGSESQEFGQRYSRSVWRQWQHTRCAAAAPAAAASASSAFGLDLLGGLDGSSSSPALLKQLLHLHRCGAPLRLPLRVPRRIQCTREWAQDHAYATTNPRVPRLSHHGRASPHGWQRVGVNFQAAVPRRTSCRCRPSPTRMLCLVRQRRRRWCHGAQQRTRALRLRIAFTVNGQNIRTD